MATENKPDGPPDDAGDVRSAAAVAADPTVGPEAAFEAYGAEPIPAAAAGAVGKDGRIAVRFSADADGQTRLVRDFAKVPFHLTGGLTHDEQLPAAATVYVQTPTAGIAQGDRHAIEVTVDPGAVAHVTGQSATKVLRMERNYGAATVDLTVGDGGYLEYLPEPTIVHRDARYRQDCSLSLGADAAAVVGEVLVPGRLARDEAFEFDHAYLGTEATGPDGLLFADANDLRPAATDPRRPGVLGDHRVLGTLYAVGDPGLSDALHERVADRADVRAGATHLPNDAGAMVRVLGEDTAPVRAAMRAAWDEARRALVGAPAPTRRKD
jgi:urease accessory protein